MEYEKKFWTIKDTLNYKHYSEKDVLKKKSVVRTFKFQKSFLLKVKKNSENSCYVIPLLFVSSNYPRGFYKGITGSKSMFVFYDEDILEVIK